jgi:hypothetical protein
MTKITILDNKTDFFELTDHQDCLLDGGRGRVAALKGERTTTLRVAKSLKLIENHLVMVQSIHPDLNGASTETFKVIERLKPHPDGTVTWRVEWLPKTERQSVAG